MQKIIQGHKFWATNDKGPVVNCLENRVLW